MAQKTQFIADCLKRRGSISELCTNYCISCKTASKWIDRKLRAVIERRHRGWALSVPSTGSTAFR